MCNTLYRHRLYRRIRYYYLVKTPTRRVPFICRFDVRPQEVPHGRQLTYQVALNFGCPAFRAVRLLQPQAFESFDLQPFNYAQDPFRGDLVDLFCRDRLLIVEARKQNLEEVLANLSDSPL